MEEFHEDCWFHGKNSVLRITADTWDPLEPSSSKNLRNSFCVQLWVRTSITPILSPEFRGKERKREQLLCLNFSKGRTLCNRAQAPASFKITSYETTFGNQAAPSANSFLINFNMSKTCIMQSFRQQTLSKTCRRR